MNFWQRHLKITIETPDKNKIVFTDLYKIIFNVSVIPNQINSKAEILIYNASQSDVDKIISNAGKAIITLEGGYESDYGTIFIGSIMNAAQVKPEPTDIALKLWCWTNPENIAKYTVNDTYNKGISNIDLIKQLATKIDFVEKIDIDKNIPIETLSFNKVATGKVSDYLNNLASQYAFVWKVEGSTFKAEVENGDGIDPIVIDEKSGLIGLPEKTTIGANCRVFLNHKLKFNGKVRINCKHANITASDISVRTNSNTNINGDYYIYTLSHSGDTRGDAYYSDIQCQSYNAAGGK